MDNGQAEREGLLEWLQQLDESDEVEVTDWEASFIDSMLNGIRLHGLDHYAARLTVRQLESLRRLQEKYEDRV